MDSRRIYAAKDGQIHYEGLPCKHGHGTTRYVITGRCVVCDKENAARQYKSRKGIHDALRKLRGF